MGKRGPKPRPNHIKLIEGVEPYRLNPGEPTPDDEVAVSPPWELTEGAQAVWDEIAPDLIAKGVLTAWDVHIFTVYCESASMYRECRMLLDHSYIGRGTGGGDIVSPYFQAMTKCQQSMVQIGSKFGLTSADRANLNTGESKDDSSGLDELIS